MLLDNDLKKSLIRAIWQGEVVSFKNGEKWWSVARQAWEIAVVKEGFAMDSYDIFGD